MFDIGWPEMMVIGLVAILVIGPKDLPRALKTVGKWVRRAREMAREFQSGVDDMVREADLEDARETIRNASSVEKKIGETVDPTGEMTKAMREQGAEIQRELEREEAGPKSEPAKPAVEKTETAAVQEKPDAAPETKSKPKPKPTPEASS